MNENDKPKWEVKAFDFGKVKKTKSNQQNNNSNSGTVQKNNNANDPGLTDQPEGKLGMGDLKQSEYENDVNFFDQKPPKNINDIYNTPSDKTKAPVFDYKRLENKPILKKTYRERNIDPDNQEPTFPIAPVEETSSGSFISKDIDPQLQQEEDNKKIFILDKIKSGEINLPPFIQSADPEDQLKYLGMIYDNNPLHVAVSSILEPLLHLDNLTRTGLNKVFGTDYKMITPPELSSEDEDNKLITGGTELIASLIPLGASIKGASYLTKGLKNPFIRNMLTTGIGFMINTQPELLDNLSQNKMELKDYAIQSAKDFATGITFGALPKGTPLKIEIPYQSIVPTMVPVISDLIQGKEINSKEVASNFISNLVLGLVMNGSLPKDTKVDEVSRKVKSELGKYAEEQQTPQLINDIVIGLLPPGKIENTRTITTIKPGETISETKQPSRLGKLFGEKEKTIETETKPTYEEITFPTDRSRIIVDEHGKAKLIQEKEAQDLLLSKSDLELKRDYGMTPEEITRAKENLNKPVYPIDPESKTNSSDPEQLTKLREKISKGEYDFTPEELQIIRNSGIEIYSDIPAKNKGVRITADPRAEIEIKAEEKRIDEDLKTKYNKEPIPLIENPILLNTQSERIKSRVDNLNEAITEHNKSFEVKEPSKRNDIRREQLSSIDQRINEAFEKSKSNLSKNERRKLSETIEQLQEKRKTLKDAIENDKSESFKNDNTELPPEKNNVSETEQRADQSDPYSNEKAYIDALNTFQKNSFGNMKLPEIESHIESQVKKTGSRAEYLQSAEYKIFIKPIHDKLLSERGNKIKEEVKTVKDDLKNNIISREQYDKAIQNIKDRGNNLHSNPLDISAVKDLGIAGLYHFERGLIKLGDWAKRMVKEFGSWVKPHLKNLWKEINTPKNLRIFKENNPEAKIHTSGIELKSNSETYEQYATRIAKEFRKVPTKEEYNSRKKELSEGKDKSDPVKTRSVPEETKTVYNETGKDKSTEGSRTIDKTVKQEKSKVKKEIYSDKVYKKISEIEDRLIDKGFEGADLLDKTQMEVRKELFGKDPEIKNLTGDQKRAINKIVESHFKQEYRKQSGYDSELGNEYREKFFKDKVLRKGFKQSVNVVREMGKAGKEFAERMVKMADDEQAWMGDVNGRILDIAELNKAERNNLQEIFKAKMLERTPPNYLNDRVKEVDLKIDKYFDDIAHEFEKRGFLTKDKKTNNLRLFTPRKDYRPQITKLIKDDLGVQYDVNGKPIHNIEREKVLKHLVDTKQAKDKATAEEMLDNNIAGNRVHRAGNVEYSRGIEFPENYYITNPGEALIKYGESVAKRLAFVDAWGMNKDIADRLIDDIKKNNMNYRFVKKLFKFETGDLTWNERKSLEGINSLKSFMVLTKFTPFTALRNGFQGFLGTTTGGNLKAGITGLLKSLHPAMRRQAYESGALGQNMTKIVKENLSGDTNNLIGKMADIYLDKVIYFTTLERSNRIVSSIGGLSYMEDMFKRIKNNSKFKKKAFREFERYGLDPDEVLKRGGFSEAEKKMIMRKFTNYSEFRTRPQDLPLYWSHPTGKLVTQWKPFSYKMTQLIKSSIYDELKHGNIMPLVTMMTAYGVAGETINFIIDNIRSVAQFNPKQDDKEEKTPIEKTAMFKISEGDIGGFLDRYIEDISGLGALTFYYDIARSFGYGKDSRGVSTLLGPSIAEITQSIAQLLGPPLKYATGGKLFTEAFRGSTDDFDKTVKATLLGLYQTAGRNIPGAGIPRTLGLTWAGQQWLFPKEVTMISEYRQTLNNDEKKELDDLDNLEKSRDKAKEKALETGAREDIRIYDKLEHDLKKKREKSRVYYNLTKFKKNKSKEKKDILNKK